MGGISKRTPVEALFAARRPLLAALLLSGLVFLAAPPARPIARGHGSGSTLSIHDGPDASGPVDIAGVKLRQHLHTLNVSVRTRGKWGLGKLEAQPPARPHRDPSVCVFLKGKRSERRVCLPRSTKQGLGVAEIGAGGQPRHTHRIRGQVHRDGPNKANFAVKLGPLGIGPGKYSVHAATDWKGKPCERPGHPLRGDRCADRAPGKGGKRIRIEPVRPVGCVARHPQVINRGGATKKVALSFDDGPSSYTARVLSILHRYHVHSTFFEIGQNVPAYPDGSRAIIAAGSEIGNHSLHHETDPGSASMRATNARIEDATGYRPCLFRPPGGAYNSGVVASAASLGMSTIIWDVDPRDWSRPGTSAIESRVLSATHGGSIVLMHDGGGDRSQTVAALPKIISTLQGRGYRLVPVSKLLGYKTRYALGSARKPRPAWRSNAAAVLPLTGLRR
ncbi:hypothetical protein BH10ACT11_BH10ACT11_05550 [soil metagenome]